MKAQNTKKNIYDIVTEQIIEKLKKRKEGFKVPWFNFKIGFAENGISERAYTSINQLLLSLVTFEKKYYKNLWLTFRQIKALNGKIPKGEKGNVVCFSKPYFKGESGIIYYKKDDINEEYTEKSFLKKYYVWNVSQIENLPAKFYLKGNEMFDYKLVDEIQNLAFYLDLNFKYTNSATAFYNFETDILKIPKPKYFKSEEGFASTFFHELVHWTGNQKRLNRKLTTSKEDLKKYAFEELVAEIGANYLCTYFDFPMEINNSVSYINSWLKALNNDNKFIFKASTAAQKAVNYIINEYKEMYKAA